MTGGSLVLGLLNGMTFGLLALGVVLVYKSDRFLNLAYAQLGAAPALFLAKLVVTWGWNWWAAFVVCMAIGALVGVVVDRAFVSRLRARGGSAVSLLLLSVGISELLLALTYVSAIGPDPDRIAIAGYPKPFGTTLTIGEVILGSQDIVTLVLAPVIVVALAVFLKYSIIGKQIRAVASNRDAARLAGVSVRRVSAITWGIAGGLSAATAVLQAPSQGTFNAVTLGPGLLLVALGAAAFGAFTSIPWALAGGLLIGVVQQLTLSQTNNAGTADFVVVLLILAVVLVRGAAIGRVFATSGAVAQSRAPVPVPQALTRHWLVTRRRFLFGGVSIVVAALLPSLPPLHSEAHRFDLALLACYALVAVSLCVLVGWGGQVSLGNFAIVGIGAFVAARLIPHGLSLLLIIVIAGLAGALTLVIVGLPALRVPGLSLAVTTLGLAVIAPEWLLRQHWIGAGQSYGMQVTLPDVLKGWSLPSSLSGDYYLGLALVVIAILAMTAVRGSSVGRALIAVRDNETAAASFGVTAATTKLLALAVSGFIAGAAGVVWAGAWQSVAASQFTPDLSMAILAAPVVGGVTSLGGSVAGALLIYGMTFFVSPQLTSLFGSFGAQIGFQLALGGAGVVIAMLVYPDGIAGLARRWWERLLAGIAAAHERVATYDDPDRDVPLVVRDVRVSFGGIQALDGVSIQVNRGEVVGLIGPNGAGKSTLMNVVSGTLKPNSASIKVFGNDLSGLAAEYRPGFGLARSFQDASLFAGLTVREVVQLAADRTRRIGVLSAATAAPWAVSVERRSRSDAADVIESMGLTGYAETLVSELSTGTRRICDLAAQVASRPAVLLLDEPTAGVAQREAEAFRGVLRGIRDDLDCAVLIVEHDMALLMELCDRIYAMDAGRVIAEGTPAQIRADPAVITSYLGTSEVAIARSSSKRRTAPKQRTTTQPRRPRKVVAARAADRKGAE